MPLGKIQRTRDGRVEPCKRERAKKTRGKAKLSGRRQPSGLTGISGAIKNNENMGEKTWGTVE